MVQNNKETVKYDLDFAQQIYNTESGRFAQQCMNCGMCAISCSTREIMDYSPRQLFNLMRQGKKDEVLEANTAWYCTACSTCKARCPRGIPIVEVMHDIKKYAIENGYTDYPQAAFSKAFWAEVMARGKVFEGGVTARFYLMRGLDEIKNAFAMRDLGIKMLLHKRMPMLPPKKIKGMGDLKKIIRKAKDLELKEAGK